VLEGVLLPGSINDKIVGAYRKHLFDHKTLQDLPETPRFVINATNVQSGALWRFEKPYMRDYRVGEVKNPQVELAVAVAASSAFPPILSPAELELDHASFTTDTPAELQRPPFTTDVLLTDGGVYDNLGLETAWKRYQMILVSDGGGKESEEAEPAHDWARHSVRVLGLVDNQVRSLRKRQLIDSYVSKARDGAYWGIRTDVGNYQLADALPCPPDRTLRLALVATRLQRLEPEIQERLINWGYAVCDAALRKHCAAKLEQEYQITLRKPLGFPYPAAGIG
jgi:NTE family protein